MEARSEVNSEMNELLGKIKDGHKKIDGVKIDENKQVSERLKELIESSGSNPAEFIEIEKAEDLMREHVLNLESESVVDPATKAMYEQLVDQRLEEGHARAAKEDKKELEDGRKKHEKQMLETMANSPLTKEDVAELENSMYQDAKDLFGVDVEE